MVMATFLHRIVSNDDDHGRRNAAPADHSPNRAGSRSPFGWLKKTSNSLGNIPADVSSTPLRPPPHSLFGTPRSLVFEMDRPQGFNHADAESSSFLLQEVVREFEDNYESPSKLPSSPKSKNFVKKLVSVLEKKQLRYNVEYKSCEEVLRRNDPLVCDRTATIRKAASDPVHTYYKYNCESLDCTNLIEVDVEKKPETVDLGEYEMKEPRPRIAPRFLNESSTTTEEPSTLWIPPAVEGKKSPRKKSFKNFLSKLTKRKAKSNAPKKKQTALFPSDEEILTKEVHKVGSDKMSFSSRATSMTSMTDDLMNHENTYVEQENRTSTFSTFLTSSPVTRSDEDPTTEVIDQLTKATRNLFASEQAAPTTKLVEDSGYDSNISVLEDASNQTTNVSSRVKLIAQQLSKLPNHPWTRSTPGIDKPMTTEPSGFGEIVELRRNVAEPIYDVPNPRPKSSNHDEAFAMKRRHIMLPTTASVENGFSIFANEEEPHYATVRPRKMVRNHYSHESLYPAFIRDNSRENLEVEAERKKVYMSSFCTAKGHESFAHSVCEQNKYYRPYNVM